MSLSIPYDDDPTLKAQALEFLSHDFKVPTVGHLVGHEYQQDVHVLVLLVRQISQIEQSFEGTDEGHDPFDG